ncbi:putative mitochondrial protein fmp25 protein [Erysiphe necator]|uniref:Putative mitochondrial protein fmp25 protein n=1 Tax=Uncinula necator TaxID=52586 RepID=A0A0B1P9X4_UNCNE|nr:putative mitochondrial protein fmp25 protein [Erysiphe necator]
MTHARIITRAVASNSRSPGLAWKPYYTFTQNRYTHHKSKLSISATDRLLKNVRLTGFLLAIAFGGGFVLYNPGLTSILHAETIPAPAEIQFEQPRKKSTSPEENRELVSSQHLQVKRSWENPGVYAWGNNAGRVIENSNETYIKTPKRIPYFDGKLLRDIKLDKNFGAAITEQGDLLQWGTGFCPSYEGPRPTLKGKNLVKLSISKDRILGLSSSGKVYSVPANQSDQELEPDSDGTNWLGFWGSSGAGYRRLDPKNLRWGEKIKDISSGLEHCLMLTSKGRLYSVASASRDFPSKGQLGIPGLTLQTKSPGRFDEPYEIDSLKGFEISKIATGDYHSLVLDNKGRVFTFGDNSVGQLGSEPTIESPTIDFPSLFSIEKLYNGTKLLPKITGIAAGGNNSFFTVEATRIAGQSEEEPRNLGKITADTWSCGQGILGSLGNGRWTHVQGIPTKIKALSGLFEYDEKNKVIIPIRLARISVGQTHVSAVMDNVTQLDVDNKNSENETNWGADVLWWGGNEHYQLGTGRRNNVSQPVYIQPLDMKAEREKGRLDKHRFHITPRKEIRLHSRKVSVEQKIECGRDVTAVYSAT